MNRQSISRRGQGERQNQSREKTLGKDSKREKERLGYDY